MVEKWTSELKIIIKKQGLKPKFKSFACGGCREAEQLEQKMVISYNLFLAHRDEILAMKEQAHFLRILMKVA